MPYYAICGAALRIQTCCFDTPPHNKCRIPTVQPQQVKHHIPLQIYTLEMLIVFFSIFTFYFQSYILPLSKKKQICSKNIPTTSPLSNERIGLNDKIHSYREIHFPLIIAPSSLQILLFGIFTAVFCVFLQYFSKNNRFFVVSFWFLPTKPYICGNISMKSNIIPLIIKT